MRHFILSVLLVASTVVMAQNQAACENIVQAIYKAINQRDATPVIPHLAQDFTISGYDGAIAQQIFSQLLAHMNTQVSNISQVSATGSNGLTLVYEADFEGIGRKSSTFSFNAENQLVAAEIVTMQVFTKKSEMDLSLDNQKHFTLPMVRLGNLIGLKVQINGEERLFILDNGSPVMVLNQPHFAEQDSTQHSITSSSAAGAGGNINNMGIETVYQFKLGGISFENQSIVTMDLMHLQEAIGQPMYGLIGYEIFKDYDVLFDYNRNQVTFIKPEHTEEFLRKNYKRKKRDAVPFELSSHIPVIQGSIGGQTFTFGVDCGAEAGLFDLKLSSQLSNEFYDVTMEELMGADHNSIQVPTGKLKAITIGNTTFQGTETSFSDISHLNNGYQLNIDGLLGYDILSNQPTLISFANKTMTFIQK